jgi:hypothetical protein
MEAAEVKEQIYGKRFIISEEGSMYALKYLIIGDEQKFGVKIKTYKDNICCDENMYMISRNMEIVLNILDSLTDNCVFASVLDDVMQDYMKLYSFV